MKNNSSVPINGGGGSQPVIVERFILEPTEWNMKFEEKLQSKDKTIEQLKGQVQKLVRRVEEERLRARNMEIEADKQTKIAQLIQEQSE
jgi:hypothetical protein